MKILVTGAGGFIGKHVADWLHFRGHDITGIVHRDTDKSYNYKTVRADLEKEWQIPGGGDIIVHAAGKIPKRKGIKREYESEHFREFKLSNIDSIERLIEYAERNNIKRIINLSTIGVYGQIKNQFITENSNKINQDAYGLTKYAGELLLHDATKVEHISLRLPGVIGVDSTNIWFTNMIERFRKNEDVTIYAPDFKTRNFVWLPDLCEFIGQLLSLKKWKYECVNLGCHQTASIREIVLKMKSLTNSTSKIIVEDGTQSPFCLDDSRALELGYKSISPLEIIEKICGYKNMLSDV